MQKINHCFNSSVDADEFMVSKSFFFSLIFLHFSEIKEVFDIATVKSTIFWIRDLIERP